MGVVRGTASTQAYHRQKKVGMPKVCGYVDDWYEDMITRVPSRFLNTKVQVMRRTRRHRQQRSGMPKRAIASRQPTSDRHECRRRAKIDRSHWNTARITLNQNMKDRRVIIRPNTSEMLVYLCCSVPAYDDNASRPHFGKSTSLYEYCRDTQAHTIIQIGLVHRLR